VSKSTPAENDKKKPGNDKSTSPETPKSNDKTKNGKLPVAAESENGNNGNKTVLSGKNEMSKDTLAASSNKSITKSFRGSNSSKYGKPPDQPTVNKSGRTSVDKSNNNREYTSGDATSERKIITKAPAPPISTGFKPIGNNNTSYRTFPTLIDSDDSF